MGWKFCQFKPPYRLVGRALAYHDHEPELKSWQWLNCICGGQSQVKFSEFCSMFSHFPSLFIKIHYISPFIIISVSKTLGLLCLHDAELIVHHGGCYLRVVQSLIDGTVLEALESPGFCLHRDLTIHVDRWSVVSSPEVLVYGFDGWRGVAWCRGWWSLFSQATQLLLTHSITGTRKTLFRLKCFRMLHVLSNKYLYTTIPLSASHQSSIVKISVTIWAKPSSNGRDGKTVELFELLLNRTSS